jgi:hypothetical protein
LLTGSDRVVKDGRVISGTIIYNDAMSGTEYLNNYNANRPTILEALKHYRDKLTTLVTDEEIESGGDVLIDDLYEHLRNTLNVLSNLSHPKDADTIFNILKVYNKIICYALFNYDKELNQAKDAAVLELGYKVLSNSEAQEKTTLIQRALRFMHCDESP